MSADDIQFIIDQSKDEIQELVKERDSAIKQFEAKIFALECKILAFETQLEHRKTIEY